MSQELQKIDKVIDAKEQMLAIVSHDIKNPLSAIQLEAQMLLRAADRSERSLFSEEVRIQASRILKTTDRLTNLISDLLDKNKTKNDLSNISRSPVDCIRLIHDVLDALRPLISEKGIILKLCLPTSVIVSIDRSKIFQVFSNLLSNAVKFTPNNGTIRLSIEENNYEFIFSVDDSGPGLSEQEARKVFEKYWCSNSKQGTGLGLFICKTIIEAHNGHIFIERNSDLAGACFRFTLPKLLNSGNVPYFIGRNDQRKKIYVIDDDDDLREVISWALSKEGYAVFSYESPQMALDSLVKGFHMPQLMVVDYRMDEMKGSEFLFKKNKIPKSLSCPVLMISASPKEIDEEVPKQLYQEVFTKPIDLETLVNTVKKYLGD